MTYEFARQIITVCARVGHGCRRPTDRVGLSWVGSGHILRHLPCKFKTFQSFHRIF